MGVVASILFAGRNAGKCVTGHETARGAVAACQMTSSVDGIVSSGSSLFSEATKKVGGAFQYADDVIENVFKKVGGESGEKVLNNITSSTGASTKVGALAQKAVNPLLCVAAGVRVLKDDDQYAALIEESAAMGCMFGAESLMKYARSGITGANQATKGLAGKTANLLNKSSKISGWTQKASEWFKKLGKTKNGNAKQTLIKIGLDVLFVGGSILAYTLGRKAAEKISGREKQENL